MRTVDICPACGSDNKKIVAQLDEDRRRRFLAFSQIKYGGLLDKWLDDFPPIIMHCASCGHCWYKFQPEEAQLGRMYAAGRRLVPDVKLSREPSPVMLAEMARLRWILRNTPGQPTLLDYGSGYGRWARAGVIQGFTVTAYEPAVSRGAEEGKSGFELLHDLSELDGRRFDVINLEQVLEHVRDPFGVLLQIKEMCSPSTIIRITVPNLIRAEEGRNLWESWPFNGTSPHTMAPFEHLHGFTPSSLHEIAKRVGLVRMDEWVLWRQYPLDQIRHYLGQVIPLAGKTALLVRAK